MCFDVLHVQRVSGCELVYGVEALLLFTRLYVVFTPQLLHWAWSFLFIMFALFR